MTRCHKLVMLVLLWYLDGLATIFWWTGMNNPYGGLGFRHAVLLRKFIIPAGDESERCLGAGVDTLGGGRGNDASDENASGRRDDAGKLIIWLCDGFDGALGEAKYADGVRVPAFIGGSGNDNLHCWYMCHVAGHQFRQLRQIASQSSGQQANGKPTLTAAEWRLVNNPDYNGNEVNNHSVYICNDTPYEGWWLLIMYSHSSSDILGWRDGFII